MKHWLLFFLGIVCCSLIVFSSSRAEEKPKDGFSLKTQLQDGWVVDYKPEPPSFITIQVEGKLHILFDGGASLEGGVDHTGEPLLPIDVLTLGIPHDASLQVELLEPVYEDLASQLVAPYPSYTYTNETEPVAEYKKNNVAYSRNKFFPAKQYVVDAPALFREQRIASVRISPYQYNPATKVLRRLVRATLQVKAKGATGTTIALPPSSAVVADPFFEETYKSALLNYNQAKGWRRSAESLFQSRVLQDSTRDWFETGKNYYKMPIAEDGWYKVTKAQLVAAGANPSLIDVPTLKIFYRGVQIPIVVRPDTSVEFYGRRNYGDSTYTDFFTDTSAYWLTWGGAAGLRFTPSFVDSAGSIQNRQSAFMTKHFEENNYYYQGTTTSDIINIETIPGEGWAWGTFDQWFFPNTTNTYPFSLDNVELGASQQATIRVRLVSTTLNYTNPNHRARFWVNDSLVGETTFAGRTSIVFSANIPHSWLRNGGNVLKILSVLTPAIPNQFYLDWFEVDCFRFLRAQNNQLAFAFPAPGAFSRIMFDASGFSSPQVEVFDILSKRNITSTRITSSGAEYSITFRDSLSAPRLYVVAGTGGARLVPSVKQKMFADIRVNTQGADYIVITHRNFLTTAQQLALHRQTTNGVRTKIIDVEDIYDEFNYGIMNATKLKPFLKHAYQNWTLPKPAYLLLLGDACWDYHRFLSTTINSNFVPSYGIPVSDNWFVCFNADTSALPSMLIGRIPVKDAVQAQRTMQKVIGYDSYLLSEWNKNFLFITGGNDLNEQALFNGYSEEMINTKVIPPPIGGTAFRVYKTTRGAIDGENKRRLKELVRNGLVFMNFIGHSGGRIWGVDIGPPGELENTDGKLPFVSSTSCNVGGFAEPSGNVLAEDFLLADNRGSIASWASSTLGYANYGRDLARDFLQGVRDSIRSLGALTTNAKIKMLRAYGPDYIAVSTVYTNNLLGDPLSRFALPLMPDLTVLPQHIVPSNPTPTVNDTLVLVKVKMLNYGLVTPDSVGVTVTDLFNGITTSLVTNKKLAPMRQVDSITVEWRGMNQVGLHTLTASLDPTNSIPEVNELNNIASKDQYVYANLLSVVKPIRNMVIASGVQRLVVTSPVGVDSSGFSYEFQLDTVDTFDSPALVSSGLIPPTAVTGEWLTPSLSNNRVYFWRARTKYAQTLGKWAESLFSTSSDVPVLPSVRWRENSAKQFRRDILNQAVATDTGVTIAPSPSIDLYVRSVGYRYNQLAEYYSIIRVNEQQIRGYWFEPGIGSSFMVMRLNDFSGVAEFKTFNTSAFPPDTGLVEARRMTAFINETPVGNYLAFSVIFDGATGVTESLKVALERLGSTLVQQIQPGQSWALIGRKGNNGPGMPALEGLTNDTVALSLQVPNYYSYGKGSITTYPMFIPNSWDSFHWRQSGLPSTNTRVAFLGVRPNGPVDTLRIFPKDSADINLSFLNSMTSGARYTAVQTAGLLSTADALFTPSLRDWWMDVIAPADLAISARTISGDEPASTRNIEVTVYNIGYQDSDSSNVILSVYDRQNRARQVASVSVLPIAAGSSRTMIIPISTTNLPRRATLQAMVNPAKKAKDLVAENNTAYYSFNVTSVLAASDVQVYANGSQVMDGDFVPASPTLTINIPKKGDEQIVRTQVQFLVDNRFVSSWISASDGQRSEERPTFTPQFSDGVHQLRFKIASANTFGEVDSVDHLLSVNVSRESRIMQMYNYPNPFSQDTYITLMLAGSVPPEELAIRIFTIAGRKIREIAIPSSALQVGFNRIYWDGRDADGDEVANGYYFYQASIKGEGKTQSEIQKLVKVK